MDRRIKINFPTGAYEMDIVNKLVMPLHRNEDKLRQFTRGLRFVVSTPRFYFRSGSSLLGQKLIPGLAF